MDMESGMSGKNRKAVHFNLSKGKGEEKGQKREGRAEALQNCLTLPHSVPVSEPQSSVRIHANLTKLFQSLKRRRRPQVRKRMGTVGSVMMHCIL